MNMNTTRDIEQLIGPALAAYSAECDRHWLTSYMSEDGTCKCGWQPPATARNRRISLGMHLKAAQRAADVAYDRDALEAIRA